MPSISQMPFWMLSMHTDSIRTVSCVVKLLPATTGGYTRFDSRAEIQTNNEAVINAHPSTRRLYR